MGEKIERLLKEAEELAQSGDLRAAKRCVEEVMQLTPSDSRSWIRLGTLQNGLRQPEAKLSFERATELDPTSAEAFAGLGWALEKADDGVAAVAAFRQSAALEPCASRYADLADQLWWAVGDRDEAEKVYRQALDFEPENTALLMSLGSTCRRTKPDEARRIYDRILEIEPAHPGAHAEIGLLLAESGDHEHAEEWVRRSLELDASDIWPHIYLSMILRSLDRMDEAVAAAQRACDVGPQDSEPQVYLARAYQGCGQSDEAEEHFRIAAEIDPRNTLTLQSLARFLAKTDRREEARRWLDQILTLEPDFKPASELEDLLDNPQATADSGPGVVESRLSAPRLRGKACRATDDGDLVEALRCLHRAVELEPCDARIWLHLGDVQYKSEHYDAAADSFRRAVELDPTAYTAHVGLGQSLQEVGECDQAVRAFEYAVAIKPNVTYAWVLLSAAQHEAGDKVAAEHSARKAVELEPEFDEALANLALAICDERPDEALELLRKAIAIDPAVAWVHGEMGHILYRRRQYVEAEQALRKSLALNDSQLRVHLYLARVLARLGREAEAHDEYLQVCAAEPCAAFPQYFLASFYRDTDRLEQSERCYHTAVENELDDPEAAYSLGSFLEERGDLSEAKK